MEFTARPVTIEARQFTGTMDDEIERWLGDAFISWEVAGSEGDAASGLVIVTATDDEATVNVSEWIVRDTEGGFVAMTDDAFHEMYSPSEPPTLPPLPTPSVDPERLSPALVVVLATSFADDQHRDWAMEHASDPTCPYPHGPKGDDGTLLCPVLASYVRNDELHAAMAVGVRDGADQLRAREDLFRREFEQAQVQARERARAEGRMR